jgi:uncharacterized protein (TIGR01777 family)
MHVLVSGAGGLIGRSLVPALQGAGHQVSRLVRSRLGTSSGDIAWSPGRDTLDAAALEGVDGVVHLAGEPILGRWTAAKRARIRDSRVSGTALLARTLAGLARKPSVLVCASASGYYGDRGDELLTEESAPGTGFLADVCREWEAAALPARQAGTRVAYVRTGLALARDGGLLGTLLLPFRLGLGGPIGRGGRFWSWIAIDDLVDVFRFALESHSLSGAVNAVAPHPLTNGEFARTLGRALSRPALVPVPPAALRLVFGREAANEAMLASARLVPARLLAAGFRFRYPELEGALRHVLHLGADSR